jgi:dephospho-CoA kinase
MVGLIGGIGAGKSTVADRFTQLGALVIDADKVGHEVLNRPEVASELIRRFGEGIVGAEGRIDRQRLGPIVFTDEARRKELEGVVHPAIRQVFLERIGAGMQDENIPLIVLDAAVLLEASWGDVCDKILFVDAPREIRLERLRVNRGWPEAELDRRESAQLPLEIKRSRADVIIVNDGDIESCHRQIDQWFEEWTVE